MTTFRQIEANRRNALKSTGPKTEAGKEQSRRNAVRHGLTAETVIGREAVVIADYDARSAVERELVLRLASLLWRLRRATTMETGLFEIQAEHLREYRHGRQLLSNSQDVIHATLWPANVVSHDPHTQTAPAGGPQSANPIAEFARCFLRLANLSNFALDRLSRYEATLWRQASQILYALEALDRGKPQERTGRFWFASKKQIECE
jgi:hypothetical protein